MLAGGSFFFACFVVAVIVGQSEVFAVYDSLAHGGLGELDINAVWAAGRRIINGLSLYAAEALS